MMDQVQENNLEGNKTIQASLANNNIQNAQVVLSPKSPQKKQKDMQQLIKSYIKESTSIHRERLQRLQQANQIIGKQCRTHEADLDKIKQNKAIFNRQLDMMIAMLKQIDRVQGGIMQCQRNAKLINQLIGQIEKKLNAKLQKKFQILQKIKKIKK